MHKKYLLIVCTLTMIVVESCSRKTTPSRNETGASGSTNTSTDLNKSETGAPIRSAVKRKPKETIPAVIVVKDQFAKKSVDGRLYYDLQGHRYWRSSRDGKYYLFNKSMATDDAFKAP